MHTMTSSVATITASKTNDEYLDGTQKDQFTPAELIDYLQQSPRNALVLHDFTLPDGVEDELTPGPSFAVYVVRGASERLNNFYYGELPAEDPNDAEGGALTAEEVLEEALLMLAEA